MPHANGANFVSEEPDASYYRTPGHRPTEGRGSSAHGERAYGSDRRRGTEYDGGYGQAPDERGGPGRRNRQTPPSYQPPTQQAPQGYRSPQGYQAPPARSTANPYGDPTRGGRYAQDQNVPARGRQTRERGLPGWLAVGLLIAIAGASGLIDSLSGASVRGVFNYGLVLASLVAILVVRRSQMFPVVISPPLVYFVASGALLYIRSGGLHDRGKLIDAATNWVVYGFPAIAGATAVVLVVAGLRMVTHR